MNVTLRLSLARLSRSLLDTRSIVVMRRLLPPHPPAHTLPPGCSSLLPQPHKTSCEGVPGARRPWTLPNAAHPAAGRAAPGARQGAMHWKCRGVMMADVAGGARLGAPASRTPRRRSGPRGHQIGARASACTNAARVAAAAPLPSRAQITSTVHAHSSRIQARHFHQSSVPCIFTDFFFQIFFFFSNRKPKLLCCANAQHSSLGFRGGHSARDLRVSRSCAVGCCAPALHPGRSEVHPVCDVMMPACTHM